jgi:hypothetical protein
VDCHRAAARRDVQSAEGHQRTREEETAGADEVSHSINLISYTHLKHFDILCANKINLN